MMARYMDAFIGRAFVGAFTAVTGNLASAPVPHTDDGSQRFHSQ
jgi:hypothetical protein